MDQLKELPIPLLLWYRENARVLPWRSAPHPLPGVGVGDHAPADPGGGGAGLLSTAFWRPCPPWPALAAVPEDAADEAVAGAGLLQPGPKPAKGRPADGGGATAAASRRPMRASEPCPASGTTPPGPSPPSPSASLSRRWTATCCGWLPGSRETRGTSPRRPPRSGGPSPGESSPWTPQATSIRPDGAGGHRLPAQRGAPV